jgi:serine/threonine protein kinase
MAVRIEPHAEPIPGYKLIERLGGGGFGEVWKCEAPGGLHKAIKFVFGDLKASGEKGHRAEQELKALSRVKTVRHPYILSLERYDIIDGQLLIVMELADRNLWDRYKECRVQGLPGIPHVELLDYMKETAEALDLMNGQYQLQHLDIKPQNLFLVHSHVKVADFGLVKDLEGVQAAVTGGVTPVYAAPETFDGWVSRFSDQYSLAIVYQELLTGVRPFSGTNLRQLILQHLQSPPNVAPLPPGDQPVILRALSKNPDQRFPSCRDLVHALLAAGAAPPETPEEGEEPPTVVPYTLRSPTPASEEPAPSTADNPRTSSIRGKSSDSNRGTTPLPRVIQPLPGSAPGVPTTARRPAPTETQGDGALFPALVLGVGGLGTVVLQRLRECLYVRHGALEPFTNLRLLALDTDPEASKAAARGNPATALPANDVLLLPLNRPSHYVKPREGRPPVDTWLNPQMVFRIPRNQVTAGVRALGRLAFCDHYKAVTRRLQAELDALLDPEALAAAVRDTGLGLRTSRPRVYVVAGLCGGTGGGMFLDLAYTLRALLRQAGYSHPDVVGVLLAPVVDRNRPPSVGMGNAYAALAELCHFGSPKARFTARYLDREPPLEDPDPPFSRCVLLSLPDEDDAVAVREATETAGVYLAHDACSPVGRVMDLSRAEHSGPPWESRGLFYQTFGQFRLHWPRALVLRAAARQLCHRLVRHWMSKDGRPVRDAVRAWVQDQWTVHDLAVENFVGRLQAECVKGLGKSAESVLAAAVQPFAQALEARAGAGRRGAPPAEVPPEEVAETLGQLAELIGKPTDEGLTGPGTLTRLLREAAEKLAHEWGQKLAEMPVRLIEDPHYRLAGAEEAVRHMAATIEQALQGQEAVAKDLTTRASEAYGRLRALAAPPRPGAKRFTLPPADVLELLRCYPKWRYQSLVMRQVVAAFVGMRGHLSDELGEINACRVRLAELDRAFEPEPAAGRFGDAALPAPSGRCLFPEGCAESGDAVGGLLEQIGPEELTELDARAQAMMKEQFTALVTICLSSANQLKNVEAALLRTAAAFAAERLPETDVARLFFEKYADEEHALAEIEGFFGEAAPELAPRRAAKSVELCVLATPPGPDGDRFHELVREALPKVEIHPAPGGDDILLYRELPYLPLLELDQLGPYGQEAYRQMAAMENFTPHSRCDISFAPAS